MALAWLLHNPVVTAPIIGPRTAEQLDGALRASTSSSTPTCSSAWTRSSRARAARARGLRLVGRAVGSAGLGHDRGADDAEVTDGR